MKPFAFVFPGQGSQSVGMLDAWGDHPAVRDTLAEASQALGEDLGALIHAGPKEQLDLTANTQPVMLTAAVACYRAWRAEGSRTFLQVGTQVPVETLLKGMIVQSGNDAATALAERVGARTPRETYEEGKEECRRMKSSLA